VSKDFDFPDVQGLLRFGYKHHTEGAFALLRVRNHAAARAWLASAQVATGAKGPLPRTVLQVAFSAEGLRELGVPAQVMATFAPEFVAGLAPTRIARVDSATSATTTRRIGNGAVRAWTPCRTCW